LAASVDDRIQIWEVKRWRRGGFELKEGDHDPVRAICFSSNWRKLVASGDQSIKIWELENRKCVQKIKLDGNGRPVSLTAFDDISSRLLTNVGCYVLQSDSTVKVSQSGTVLCTTEREGYGITHEGDWVTWGCEKVLWLPPEYRPVCAAVIPIKNSASPQLSAIALGCWSGRAVVLRFLGIPPIIVTYLR
jgi:WD40 repeat protein